MFGLNLNSLSTTIEPIALAAPLSTVDMTEWQPRSEETYLIYGRIGSIRVVLINVLLVANLGYGI